MVAIQVLLSQEIVADSRIGNNVIDTDLNRGYACLIFSRLFYDIDSGNRRVRVLAVGLKDGDKLFIGGEEVQL